MMNNNRPISSYHRSENNKATLNPEDNIVKSEKEKFSSNKNINNNNNNTEKIERQQSGKPIKDNNISSITNKISDLSPETSSKKKENIEIDYKKILERFNEFIKKHKIKKEDFIESEDLFLNKEDFKDCFKKLRFELNKDEENFLFHYNNQYSTNDFIRMKNFLELFPLEFVEFKTENISPIREDMKKINQDFKNLHVEIFDIIRNDIIELNLNLNDNNNNNNKDANMQIGKMKRKMHNNYNNNNNNGIKNIYSKDNINKSNNLNTNTNMNNKMNMKTNSNNINNINNNNLLGKNLGIKRPMSSFKINAGLKEIDYNLNNNINNNNKDKESCNKD
jgi:hypothetical protein